MAVDGDSETVPEPQLQRASLVLPKISTIKTLHRCRSDVRENYGRFESKGKSYSYSFRGDPGSTRSVAAAARKRKARMREILTTPTRVAVAIYGLCKPV